MGQHQIIGQNMICLVFETALYSPFTGVATESEKKKVVHGWRIATHTGFDLSHGLSWNFV